MKKTIYIVLMLLLLPNVLFSQQQDTLANVGQQVISIANGQKEFTKSLADSLYSKGQYQSAADIYEHLLTDKGISSDVYYNLGNAYYRLGMFAKSILNYERALLLSPSDSDIKSNLALAYSKTVDKYEEESEMFYTRWFEGMKDMASSDTWAYIAVSAFILFLVMLSVYVWGKKVILKKIGFYCSIICLLLTIISNVCAYSQRNDWMAGDKAIVMIPSITVRSTPSDGGTALFVIHEGYKVNVIDNSMKEWVEISINAEKSGWVPAEALEII